MKKRFEETAVDEIPSCQFCTKPAAYDGKTKGGPWAYMCWQHFEVYGVGLGLGRGQRLILGEGKEPDLL